MTDKRCEYSQCGKPIPGTFGSGRFCDRSCMYKRRGEIMYNKSTRMTTCPQCGKTFRKPRAHSTYCSKTCTPQNNKSAKDYQAMGLTSASKIAKRSRGETELANRCIQNGWTVTTNDNLFGGWDADILLHDFKIAIHYDGPCHRRVIYRGQSLSQIQTRDRLKRKAVRQHGWTNYTIVAEGKYNGQFIDNEFDRLLKFVETKGKECADAHSR